MIEVNNKTRSLIDLNLIKKTVKKFLNHYYSKYSGVDINKIEVSIAIVGDQATKKLNKKYLGNNQATDVLAFPGEENYLGEIIINYSQIKRQAKEYNNTIKKELIHILIHGLLHLVGYSDKSKKGRGEMDELTKDFICKQLV
ncbi:MAG: rRNA maturation RNase YbeY [Patescibacteria group bacterium]